MITIIHYTAANTAVNTYSSGTYYETTSTLLYMKTKGDGELEPGAEPSFVWQVTLSVTKHEAWTWMIAENKSR